MTFLLIFMSRLTFSRSSHDHNLLVFCTISLGVTKGEKQPQPTAYKYYACFVHSCHFADLHLLWSALYIWMNVEMAHKNSLPSATILKCYFNRVKVHAGRLSTTKPSIFIVYLLLCGPESFQSESKQTCISKLICRCFCYFLATLSSSSSWSWSSTWITTRTLHTIIYYEVWMEI